ncbi:MAG: diguanylate cyclase [Acidipila sp.]|nr:diguanylate cyclase [Acidipila sp.]
MSSPAHGEVLRGQGVTARSGGGLAAHRNRVINVLFIHDNPLVVELCLQEMKWAQFAVSMDLVHNGTDFVERLSTKAFDVVVCDSSLKHWTGIQALEILRNEGREIPFIVLAEPSDEATVGEFVKKGASDWVDKYHLALLPMAVALAVEQKALREERNRAVSEARRSEAHYRALVENPTFGVCRFEPGGKLLAVNQAMVTMLGYESIAELLAVNLVNDIIRDPAERKQFLEAYQQSTRINCIELEWRRKDGSPMKVRLSGCQVDHEASVQPGFGLIVEDVTAQCAMEEHLRHMAATDALTGLANYRQFARELDSEIKRSQRTERAFSVLIFDVDDMKSINDGFGHLAGNRALCRMAMAFRSSCRSIDTPARYGGDEFAIVLPETTAREADLLGDRVRDYLAHDAEYPKLSISVGAACYPQDGETIEALLHKADQALYAMKNQHQRVSLALPI